MKRPKSFLSTLATLAILLLAQSVEAQAPSMGNNPYINPANPRPYPPGHRPPKPPPLPAEIVEMAKKLLRDRVTEIRAQARKGDYKAQYNLGVVHVYGAGATLDFKQAFENFRKSAEEAVYAPATFNLAICYAKGLGTELDRVQAYKWWNLAAAQGHPQAAAARDNIARYMNRRQIAAAQSMATGYERKLELRILRDKLKAQREKISPNSRLHDAAYNLSHEFFRKR
ncbi:MAG: hypothetical protein CMO74_10550 [Verrucomicrobiales bacterium]|nr:hypothetical protein [Verrucomicrobiales bacterium]MBL68869.1 hypothetical protein [Verrucomicrobiales bacterium]|tara:strand:- start:24553 stop:25233 length:681 start_codon:yes stop_codon:yes gene_type:complete